MTTKNSPLSALKAQADQMAATLKGAERGECVDVRFVEKIKAARANETIKVGLVMDDKVVSITFTWSSIRESSEAGLSEYIVKLMREAYDETLH